MKSTSKNFIYNVLYHLFIYLIPLVIVPYISRVLGPNNIGIYSYTYSIVSYFMLASMLGINNYGSREIAKISNDKEKMSKVFFSIYWLQLICNLIMISLYLILLIVSTSNREIMTIQLIFLISCAFDINWFYFGLEKFKITISRNFVIKLISLFLIFSLVKTSNDLWIYTLIMGLSTLVSQVYLWLFLKKYITFVPTKFSDVFSHLKQCLILFIPVIAYSIYRIMDKTMIGAMNSTIELGYYENAEKIISIPLSFVSALGTIMIPHMSKISKENFHETILYSFKLCFFLILPMIIGLFLISNDFTIVFFGSEFEKSKYIICMLLPTILFGGVTSVIRTNFLIPKSKDKIYVVSTIIGALINFILNFSLIPQLGAFGACIGTIVTEFTIMLYQIISTHKDINYKILFSNIIPFVYKSLTMGVAVIGIGVLINNSIARLTLQILFAIIIYVLMNYNYIKNDFLGIKKKKKNKI